MVKSGIKTSAEAREAYEQMQSKHVYRYLIFKIDGDEIVLEESKAKDDSKYDHSEFCNKLHSLDGPRYAVVDFAYQETGLDKTKLCFILWVPENSGVKNKMKYASAKDEFKRNLNGIQKDFEAHDEADIEEEEILKKILG